MNKPLIFGIGEIVWDCLPSGKKLGGAPVSFAYYADTVGARDSFTAAFITSILSGKNISEADQAAVALAAKVCSRPGAIIEI